MYFTSTYILFFYACSQFKRPFSHNIIKFSQCLADSEPSPFSHTWNMFSALYLLHTVNLNLPYQSSFYIMHGYKLIILRTLLVLVIFVLHVSHPQSTTDIILSNIACNYLHRRFSRRCSQIDEIHAQHQNITIIINTALVCDG